MLVISVHSLPCAAKHMHMQRNSYNILYRPTQLQIAVTSYTNIQLTQNKVHNKTQNIE